MTIPLTKREQLAADLVAMLAQFTGTQRYTALRYPWLRGRFLLSDGAKFLAGTAKAYWLMDAIASHQPNKKVASEPFQVWTLTVNDQQAVLLCTDGNEHELVRQEIPYTDFLLSEITLYVEQSGDDLVVLLPSEH